MKCVYGIFEKDKIIYIGSTKNFTKRTKEHKNGINSNSFQPIYQYIRRKCNVFDDCFTIKPIVDVEPETPKNILISLEKDYINLVGLENLLNVCSPEGKKYRATYHKKEKITCKLCDCEIFVHKWVRHVNSQRHQRNMKFFTD
jgi:hypothetical protein